MNIKKNENFVYTERSIANVEFMEIRAVDGKEVLFYLPLTGGFYERLKDLENQIIINIFLTEQSSEDDSTSE